MSRIGKISLGVVSAIPALAYILFYLLSTLMVFVDLPFRMTLISRLPTFMNFVVPVMAVFYMVHAFSNRATTGVVKAFWAVVLCVVGPLTLPFYWFFYIWKDHAFLNTPSVPELEEAPAAAPVAMPVAPKVQTRKFCTGCGTPNNGLETCAECGKNLVLPGTGVVEEKPAVRAPVPDLVTPASKPAPIRNDLPRYSVYLAIAAVLLFIPVSVNALPVGIATIFIGIKGIRIALSDKAVGGVIQSLVGIITGVATGTLYILMYIYLLTSLLMFHDWVDTSQDSIFVSVKKTIEERVVSVLTRHPDEEGTWYEHAENAEKFVEQKKYVEAYNEYKQSLEMNPDNYANWEGLANVAYELGERNEAIEAYEKVLELRPESHGVYKRLYELYLANLNYSMAMDRCISATYDYPIDDSVTDCDEVIVQRMSADPKQAHLVQILDGRSPLELCAIGQRLSLANQLDEAVVYLERAYAFNKFTCTEELAITYTRMGQLPRAMKIIENGRDMELERGNEGAYSWYYYNLGFLNEITGDYEEANRLYKKAMVIPEKDIRAKEGLKRMVQKGYY